MAQLARAAANDSTFAKFSRSLGSLTAVEGFVRDNYVYRDETEEIVRDPRFMLADMGRIDDSGRVVQLEGDCDDVSTLFAAFALALGKSARFVAIRYTPTASGFEHVFAEAYDGGQWRILDATVPPGTNLNWIESMIEEV